jgi:hypothetical protein
MVLVWEKDRDEEGGLGGKLSKNEMAAMQQQDVQNNA